MSNFSDLGFTISKIKDGYSIHHHDRLATHLRGAKALKFEMSMDKMSFHEQQQLMARLTGNYKRGNEK